MAVQRRRAGGQRRARRNPAGYAPGMIRNATGGAPRRRMNQYGIHDGQAAGPWPWLQGMHQQSGMASAAGRPGGNGFGQKFPPGFSHGNAWWKQNGTNRQGGPFHMGGPMGPMGQPFMPHRGPLPVQGPGRPGGRPGPTDGRGTPGRGDNYGSRPGVGYNDQTGQYGVKGLRRMTRQMQKGYKKATGMPLDPNYILARTQAQGQLSGSLAGLSAQRGYLGAQNTLDLSRLATQQGQQTDLLNEQLAGRGIYGSSIATDDRFKLATDYTRQRQDMANNLLQQYGQLGAGANQAWLDYQNSIAQALYSSARSNTNSPAVAKRGRRR